MATGFNTPKSSSNTTTIMGSTSRPLKTSGSFTNTNAISKKDGNTGNTISNITKNTNTSANSGKSFKTAIKVKDYLPQGEKSNMWSGIFTGGLDQLSGLTGGMLGNGSLKDISSKISGASSSVKGLKGLNEQRQSIFGSNNFGQIMSNLSPAQKNLLNSPGIEKLREQNNESLIKNKLPFIGGLTSSGLDNAKSIQLGGMTLTGNSAKMYEKLGLASGNLHMSETPSADKINLSWGQALNKAITSPQFIATATTSILKATGLDEKLSNTYKQVSDMSGISAEDIMNIHSETDAYVFALQQVYKNMSDEDKSLMSLYKYYKINMNYHNSAAANPDGTGYNLGQEVSDHFFGSINQNVTNFLDGTSDYISETWQNISYTGAEFVKDQFDGFSRFAEAFEGATGIGLSLDPKFQEGIYNTMEKLGFGNLGIGTDTRAFITTTLVQRTYAVIESKGKKVNVDHAAVLYYFERFDYRNKLTAERRIKVRLTNNQLANIDLNDKELTISIQRRYGFTLGQSPTGTMPVDFNTEFTEVERDSLYQWPAKIVGGKEKGDKESQAKKNHKRTDSSSEPPDRKTEFQTQDFEFIITPPLLTGNRTSEMFNGIADGENTIMEILDSAFQSSYEEGVLCPAVPINNFVLKDVAIPPTNFEGLLQQFQKEYGIYDGGPVIFHDRLAVNGQSEDVYFLLPKRGVVDMEFDEGWTIEFRVRHIETPDANDMICFLEPSRKKIIWPITERDIRRPGDSKEFSNKGTTRYAKGSTIGAQQPGSKETLNQEVIQTNTEYLVPDEQKYENYDHIYIKVPNAFFTFTPGDMVTVKWRDQVYKANVKEWASQYSDGLRIILLVLISKIDDTKKTWADKVSPGNWIQKMQESIAGTNAKITNTLNNWSDKTGNWLQDQFQAFSKWEDEHLKFKGMNILEWMQMVDPDIEAPVFDQEANTAMTEIQYLRELYSVDYDNPYMYGTMHNNATNGRLQNKSQLGGNYPELNEIMKKLPNDLVKY